MFPIQSADLYGVIGESVRGKMVLLAVISVAARRVLRARERSEYVFVVN